MSSSSKRCTHCLREKAFDEFGKNSRTKDGMQAWCRSCFREYNSVWYPGNRRRVLDRKKKQYAQRKFGQ